MPPLQSQQYGPLHNLCLDSSLCSSDWIRNVTSASLFPPAWSVVSHMQNVLSQSNNKRCEKEGDLYTLSLSLDDLIMLEGKILSSREGMLQRILLKDNGPKERVSVKDFARLGNSLALSWRWSLLCEVSDKISNNFYLCKKNAEYNKPCESLPVDDEPSNSAVYNNEGTTSHSETHLRGHVTPNREISNIIENISFLVLDTLLPDAGIVESIAKTLCKDSVIIMIVKKLYCHIANKELTEKYRNIENIKIGSSERDKESKLAGQGGLSLQERDATVSDQKPAGRYTTGDAFEFCVNGRQSSAIQNNIQHKRNKTIIPTPPTTAQSYVSEESFINLWACILTKCFCPETDNSHNDKKNTVPSVSLGISGDITLKDAIKLLSLSAAKTELKRSRIKRPTSTPNPTTYVDYTLCHSDLSSGAVSPDYVIPFKVFLYSLCEGLLWLSCGAPSDKDPAAPGHVRNNIGETDETPGQKEKLVVYSSVCNGNSVVVCGEDEREKVMMCLIDNDNNKCSTIITGREALLQKAPSIVTAELPPDPSVSVRSLLLSVILPLMDVPPIETNVINISVSSRLHKSNFKPGKSAVSMGICPSSYPALASNILTPSSSVPTGHNSNPTVSGKHSLNHQRMVSGSHSPYPLKEAVLCGKSWSSIFIAPGEYSRYGGGRFSNSIEDSDQNDIKAVSYRVMSCHKGSKIHHRRRQSPKKRNEMNEEELADYRDWLDGNLYKMVPSDIEDECDAPNLDCNNNTKNREKKQNSEILTISLAKSINKTLPRAMTISSIILPNIKMGNGTSASASGHMYPSSPKSPMSGIVSASRFARHNREKEKKRRFEEGRGDEAKDAAGEVAYILGSGGLFKLSPVRPQVRWSGYGRGKVGVSANSSFLSLVARRDSQRDLPMSGVAGGVEVIGGPPTAVEPEGTRPTPVTVLLDNDSTLQTTIQRGLRPPPAVNHKYSRPIRFVKSKSQCEPLLSSRMPVSRRIAALYVMDSYPVLCNDNIFP